MAELQDAGACQSNDLHVLALAQVSGARLLYSNDLSLHQDFETEISSAGRVARYTLLMPEDRYRIATGGCFGRTICAVYGNVGRSAVLRGNHNPVAHTYNPDAQAPVRF